MEFNSESELCSAYQSASTAELDSETLVGKDLVQKEAPEGLEGARTPQADLTGELSALTKETHVLVECKLEFSLRGVGQLLLYEWLWEDDLKRENSSNPIIDRQLVLGTRPPDLVPTVCSDIGLKVFIPVGTDWQDVTRNAERNRAEKDPALITGKLDLQQSPSLDSDDEESALRDVVKEQLPDVDLDSLYREIQVGKEVFSEVNPSWKADAIGKVPNRSVFYVIEVKNEPSIGGLQKAIGQAVFYASLFRHDWGLSVNQVIPTVIIRRAPWMTRIFRNNQFEDKREMTAQALNMSDSPIILYDEFEVHNN